jgi:hypothetical protein
MALGEAADLREGIGRIVRIRERIAPDPRTAAAYAGRFQVHRELREKTEKALAERVAGNK